MKIIGDIFKYLDNLEHLNICLASNNLGENLENIINLVINLKCLVKLEHF